ncbi:MAG: ACT domain-containing protein, partial [Pseudomonadota bacterium]
RADESRRVSVIDVKHDWGEIALQCHAFHLKIKVGGSWRTVAGTVSAGRPRIVEVKGMALEGDFSPVVLYVNNTDAPGFIGSLGQMLGEADINIATFHLGRTEAGGEAIALVGIDTEPPGAVIDALGKLEAVRYARVLRF